ncbi:N-acetyltransferase [Paenibacillaceae bacterium]|nr:N-acetyltransferase [Paenibacillaceae bacterium]
MDKRLYVIQDGKPVPVHIRNYTPDDFDAMIAIQQASFPPPFPSDLWWNKEQLAEHVARFPEGALCAEADGQLIGSITGLRVDSKAVAGTHSWSEITGDGYITNHNPQGDVLYIVDICVVPAYRKSGVGKWLMQSMYETVVHLRLASLAGGGRMPGYHQHAQRLTAAQYLHEVMVGKLKDPVITFLLRCGRVPAGIAPNYLEDEESCNYAAIMEWKNPFTTDR